MSIGTETAVTPAAIRPLKFERKFKTLNGDAVEEHWVTWAKKGTSIEMRQVELVKRAMRDPAIKLAIEPFYQAWLAGTQIEVNGTPLEAWAGVGPEHIEALRRIKIHSVEDFAGLTDSQLGGCGFPHARQLRDKARRYIESKDLEQQVHAAMADKDAQLAEMQRRLAELEQIALDKMAGEDRPRRGRPPKVQAEADAA